MRKSVSNYYNLLLISFANIRQKLDSYSFLPIILAVVGIIVYALQATNYMFSSRSILDEGLYLLKGYYFATGKYIPFQDYGVLTNHMPLSFVIPGLVQNWFGPGLLVGRVYSVVAGMLTLVGIWIAAKRLSGKWGAAFAVWAIALNVSLVKTYSVAFSQVLVALILSWLLAFAVGRETSRWQIIISGVLAGLLMMTRINMAPVVILLIAYFYFQHGAKEALIALAAVTVFVLFIHAIYWPGILRIWAYWIPKGWITQLDNYYPPWKDVRSFTTSPFDVWIRNLDDVTWNPIASFWDGFRFNFIAMFGVAANLLLWPRRDQWRKSYRFRLALFLNTLFLVLLSIHMWASLSGASCHAFCFSGYVGFFNIAGILALVSTVPYWQKNSSFVRIIVGIVIILIVFTGVGFGSADALGKWLSEWQIPRFLVQTSGIEKATLWGIMENKFGIKYQFSLQILPALAGFLIAVSYIGIVTIWLKKIRKRSLHRFPQTIMASVLVVGIVLSPTILLGGGDRNLDCTGNVVENYEHIASQLQDEIPNGASIYYNASNSPISLLYLKDVQIYPPQLNNVFSFSKESDPMFSDELLRFGLWNQDLLEKWKGEADYVLVEGRHYEQWKNEVEAGDYSIDLITDPMEQCRGKDSQLIVLSRQK